MADSSNAGIDATRRVDPVAAVLAASGPACAAVDGLAAAGGAEPASLRTRVGALLTPPAPSSEADAKDALFATAVVAAAGPVHPDTAARIVAACAPAGLQGRGAIDPQVVRKAVAAGFLMRWTLPGAAGGGPVLEAHPDVDLPRLRDGIPAMVDCLRRLDAKALHRVSEAASRSLNYATSLLLDPERAVARVGEVPGISW